MAFYRGPKIVTDGLVFYYDTDNVKSYVGEPTVNLLSSSNVLLTSYLDHGGTHVTDNNFKLFGNSALKNTSNPAQDWNGVYINGMSGLLTVGQTYTYSFYIYFEGSDTSISYFGYGAPGFTAVQGQWNRVSTTFVATSQDHIYVCLKYSLGQPVTTYYLANLQIELKSHPTQFINGSRSSTQGLLSLVNSKVVPNLANMSFDSTANLNYNGSNYIDFGINCYNLGIVRNATFCGWVYITSQYFTNIISDWSSSLGMALRITNSTVAEFYVYPNNYRATYTGTFSFNTWYNLVGVMRENDLYIYLNGILVASNFVNENIGNSAATLKVGVRGDLNGYNLGGKIPIVKIYNRALTSSEILQDYNALKNRFV